jgi:hypothetical protein
MKALLPTGLFALFVMPGLLFGWEGLSLTARDWKPKGIVMESRGLIPAEFRA